MSFEPTPDQIVDIQQRYADGYPIRTILLQFGLTSASDKDYDTVFNICHKRRKYRALSDPEKWEPDCMDGTEYAEWQRLMSMTRSEYHVARPCDDCDRKWAKVQRAEGICNGTLPEEKVYATEAR